MQLTRLHQNMEYMFQLKNKTVEPWVTKGIHQSGKKLRQLYKKTIEVSATDDIIAQHKKYWNNYNRLKIITKIKYYHEKCNAYKSNIKKLWKLINEITGKLSNKTNCIESLKINSVEHYMPKYISNYLGDYFANVGKQYAQKIAPSSTHINDYLLKIDWNIYSFYVLPIDRGEIKKLVLTLPNKNKFLVMIISAMFCSKIISMPFITTWIYL